MTRPAKYSAAMLILVAGAIPLLALATEAGGSAAGLSWLAGCWRGGSGNRVIEEVWMRPGSGVMLGSARVQSANAIRSIEFVELRIRGDSVDYIVSPSREPWVTYRGTMTGPHAFVVHSPTHDFPTSVGYELVGQDSLSAWIEGKDGAQVKRIPYAYRRVSCEER